MSNFNLNKVILGGRLTADVEMKQTPSGEQEFYEKHHIQPIALTEKMCEKLRLGNIQIT